MREMIEWKGEFNFNGSIEEYTQFVGQFNKLIDQFPHITATIPGGKLGPLGGVPPISILELLGDDVLARLTEGMPVFATTNIGLINGGMLNAHLHLKDKIVLLSQERFKEYAQTVATALVARRIEAKGDFTSIMQAIGEIASITPIVLP